MTLKCTTESVPIDLRVFKVLWNHIGDKELIVPEYIKKCNFLGTVWNIEIYAK